MSDEKKNYIFITPSANMDYDGGPIAEFIGDYNGEINYRSILSDDLKLRILRQLADQLGYRIAKRAGPSDPNRAIQKYLSKGKQK